jgi:hypothetical protein
MPASWVNAPSPTMLFCQHRGRPEAMATRPEMSGKSGEIDARLDAVADVQTKHDFFERGIARALAETVHRRVEMRRAGAVRRPACWPWPCRDRRGHASRFPGRSSARRWRMRSKVAKGSSTPSVSAKRMRWAPADCATSAIAARRSGSPRDASSAPMPTPNPRSRARRTCSPICVSNHRRSRCSFECRC